MSKVIEQIVRLITTDGETKAEVVGEIVRCKDCMHLSESRIGPVWCRICRKYGVGKPDDGFCDEVERKDGEQDEL